MRKRLYNVFIIGLLLIYSLAFTSCEAIKAQNITDTNSTQRANGAQGGSNNPAMNSGQNGGQMRNGRTAK